MAEIKKDRYTTVLNDGAGTSSVNGVSAPEASENDYYDNLKNESYKAMLKKEVQAAVAQDQARKYTANSLRGAGLNTQGISQSTQLGIGNAYRSALNDAQNEYNQSILNINQQQRQEELANDTANANSDYELMAGAIRGATTAEELDLIKNQMGTFGFDDNTMRNLNFLYSLQDQQLKTGTDNFGTQVDGENFYAYDANGEVTHVTKGSHFDKEYDTLTNAITLGSMPKDTYALLKNGKGETCYIYYGTDGVLRFVSRQQYEAKTDKKQRYVIEYKKEGDKATFRAL